MQAGFGKAKVNPPLGMPMEGLGQQGGIESVHDDLYVRALYLRHGEQEALILGADLLFFERKEVDRFKGAIGRRLDLSPMQILHNCSHSHASPRLTRWVYSEGPDPDYLDEIEAGYVAAASGAYADLQEVTLWAGEARTDLPVSRRKPDAEGRAQWAPYREGVTYPWVPFCLLRGGNGRVVALLFSVSCHPSMIYTLDVSAEYPGVAMRRLNDHYQTEGSLFLQGAGGDTKPRQVAQGEERWRHGTWEEMEEAGREVAEAVVTRIEEGLVPVEPDLRLARRTLRFPLADAPGRAELERVAQDPAEREARRRWAAAMLRRLDRHGHLPREVDLDLHALQLGRGLRLIGVEAELVGELGRLIREHYREGVTFPLGYTDGCRIYLPASRMIPEGGYEVDSYWEYGHPAPLQPVTDDLLAAALRGIRDSGEIPAETCG